MHASHLLVRGFGFCIAPALRGRKAAIRMLRLGSTAAIGIQILVCYDATSK